MVFTAQVTEPPRIQVNANILNIRYTHQHCFLCKHYTSLEKWVLLKISFYRISPHEQPHKNVNNYNYSELIIFAKRTAII